MNDTNIKPRNIFVYLVSVPTTYLGMSSKQYKPHNLKNETLESSISPSSRLALWKSSAT